MTTKQAITNANGTKNSTFKTFALKYSSSLYENPIGSLSLIKPDIINKTPTNILENCVVIFLKFMFYFFNSNFYFAIFICINANTE